MNTPFDPLCARYPSRRYPIYARGGMVNCSSPQAAAAGLEALRLGGNAVDAAVAKAVVQHDFDTSPLGDERGLVSGLGSVDLVN